MSNVIKLTNVAGIEEVVEDAKVQVLKELEEKVAYWLDAHERLIEHFVSAFGREVLEEGGRREFMNPVRDSNPGNPNAMSLLRQWQICMDLWEDTEEQLFLARCDRDDALELVQQEHTSKCSEIDSAPLPPAVWISS